MYPATGPQQCLDDCESDLGCVGVDVDYAVDPVLCWPHSNYLQYLEENLYSQPGTHSYQLLTRCLSTASTTLASTTTASSTAATTSTASTTTESTTVETTTGREET